MYRWFRNTHLLVGLFSFLSLAMFGVSSVQLSHRTWFAKDQAVESRLVIPTGSVDSPQALVAVLTTRYGFRGEMKGTGQINEKEIRCNVYRPGVMSQVRYSRETGEAVIQTTDGGFWGMVKALHSVHGLKHQYTVLTAWGLLLGLVSLGVMVLAVTGVYMWYKLKAERTVGWVLMVVGLLYSVSLVVMLFTA